ATEAGHRAVEEGDDLSLVCDVARDRQHLTAELGGRIGEILRGSDLVVGMRAQRAPDVGDDDTVAEREECLRDRAPHPAASSTARDDDDSRLPILMHELTFLRGGRMRSGGIHAAPRTLSAATARFQCSPRTRSTMRSIVRGTTIATSR